MVTANFRLQVYSPHTAVDAAPGGLGDWLADIVTGTLSDPEPATKTAEQSETASLDTISSDGEPREEIGDPFTENGQETSTHLQTPRPSRMGLKRTYSRPTYPEPTEVQQTDLKP